MLGFYGRIDVLVNNAGAGYLGTLEVTLLEALRQTMDLSIFWVWRVTQAVFPSMRTAGIGRTISVSSLAGLDSLLVSDAYSAARFVLEGLMEGFVPVAKRFGINVSRIEPGLVDIGFAGVLQKVFFGSPQPAREVYVPMRGPYVARLSEMRAKVDRLQTMCLE